MSLAPLTSLGPYEIVARIGAGGMGEVYRATDNNLKRSVAIKVLPAAMANDTDRLARFQREAEVLAALDDPNVAHIYGLEKTPDITALVMELVEGEDLSAVIARGPIPLVDALPIAKQIADALEAAHEHGIIHRDLKPANIKVRADGTVKVLDFGLAKAMDPVGAMSSDTASSPTITSPAMTASGAILGTAAYMSPEQARGKAVDKRADIWAFGVVLYEMLTGRRAFKGDDVSDVLVAVLSKDVDLTALPASTPEPVIDLIRRCLTRDPKNRLRDIGDARLALQERAGRADLSVTGTSLRGGSRTLERLVWVALVVAVAVLAPLTMTRLAAPPEPTVSRFELTLPVKAIRPTRPEISPDGRAIAVVVPGDDGITRIALRQMADVAFQVLPGTEDASYPFWSPDSRWIAFFSHDVLKKIAIAGGPPQTLCPAARGRGGTWSLAGVILFSGTPANAERLQKVAEAGGTPAMLSPLGLPKIVIQRWPHFMPDGRHFLFFASARQTETDGVYIGSLDEPGATRIVAGFTEARYSGGMLLFVRDTTLMAQPFDPMRRVLGPADPVVVSSAADGENEASKAFSVSDGGVLLSVPVGAALKSQLKWFDRTGQWIADLGVSGSSSAPRITRDGRRVMTSSREDSASRPPRSGSLWTTDVKTGRSQRLTFVEGDYYGAVWSPDASSVFFGLNTTATGIFNLFRQPTNGNALQEPLVVDRAHKEPQDVSLDSQYLLFLRYPTQSTLELWTLSLADRKPSLYARNGGRARLAPGGGWAAYAGNESGRFEIYLQSCPTPGKIFQISNGGGDMPVWSRDGREIFYQAGGKLLTVPVSMTEGTPVVGQPRALFDRPGLVEYDVSPDGRFLFAVPVENQSTTAVVTLNWKAALRN